MRDQIIKLLERELVGPDPNPLLLQDNGQEILENDSPTVRYGAGILFPQSSPAVEAVVPDTDSSTVEEDFASHFSDEKEAEDEGAPSEEVSETRVDFSEDTATEEPIGLANAFKPSAMGLSFLAEFLPDDILCVEVNAGHYKTITVEVAGKEKRRYPRTQITETVQINADHILNNYTSTVKVTSEVDGTPTGLELFILSRPEKGEDGKNQRLITLSLINTRFFTGTRIKTEDCFFQTSFKVFFENGKSGFIEYPENKGERLDEEEKALKLLYRHCKTYAVGHGCAAEWKESESERALSVYTSVLPVFDVKPVLPTSFKDLELSMLALSDYRPEENPIPLLLSLCNKYKDWIDTQRKEIPKLQDILKPIAERHLAECLRCYERMVGGVKVLERDDRTMMAFRLMNRAMLLQQLHFSLDLRKWEEDKVVGATLPPVVFPDPKHPSEKKGKWRPFQLAFILINIASLTDPFDESRNTADLIWFPTGGGKTEAYLGLTALTLFLRRLKKPENAGVTVLMRYTLRLLTAQQFQRAATLICACEIIRNEKKPLLGEDRISIGLWVGKELTPNDREDAITKLNKMAKENTKYNPFVLLNCPWCAAQMGITKKSRTTGYVPAKNPKTVYFVCPDTSCPFSTKSFSLPLYVIDEDIYEYKPSLIIGTVDKFAMLPWVKNVRSLFARDASLHTPPELIIQDELHLISGPLGSMVGHYETVIDELCTDRSEEKPILPKIVASTATIRRAEEQVSALFNRKVFQFPPQALRAGESFFASEDSEVPGRTYLGVHASALSSHVTTQVRVFSSLLQADYSAETDDENKRDPYYTLLSYFNNLRELGHAATLIRADIPEYMKTSIWKRQPIDKDRRRFILKHLELTSRKSGNEITESLQDLEKKKKGGYKFKETDYEERPVDICLATNMISVGLDVPRLGLMVMVGQPKTTSEYIQATSRVGRDLNSPGLVVTLYNTGKPRDRSHYEHFKTYHATLYKQVEPTSVTPWAIPVRARALHALMVAMVRILGNENNAQGPNPYPDEELIKTAYEIIRKRVADIDPGEEENVMNEAEKFMDEWRTYKPLKYGKFGPQDEAAPLIYPAGIIPMPTWGDRVRQTPSSMRSVDKTCQSQPVPRYYIPEIEDEIEDEVGD